MWSNINSLNSFFIDEGDPQEECVRCEKVYLASSSELKQGVCTECLTNERKHEEMDDESEEVLVHQHKKFSKKTMIKNGEGTTSEEDSSDSSASRLEIHQQITV